MMDDSRTKMKFQQLSPILWTKNLQETISFYETVLGFKAESNFPKFASLCRENAELMFIMSTDDEEDDGNSVFFSKPLLTGSIYIFMEQVDQFWLLVKDKAKIKTPIDDRAYLMRDFSIFDNNGYEIVFGQDISKP